MEKEYLAWIIGFSVTLFVLFIGFYVVWHEDYRQRLDIYRKRFFDVNGIKPSKKYIKDIDKFLDTIYFIFHNNYNEISESQLSKLENLYKKIFMKNVKVLYKFNHAIEISEGFEKSYIDKAMKQIRTDYKTWQKFDNTEEIY